jgi:hypothetical protein
VFIKYGLRIMSTTVQKIILLHVPIILGITDWIKILTPPLYYLCLVVVALEIITRGNPTLKLSNTILSFEYSYREAEMNPSLASCIMAYDSFEATIACMTTSHA